MCKKPDPQVEDSTTDKVSSFKNAAIAPTHSALPRNTDYDWLFFSAPALLWKVTPIAPLYMVAIARILSAKIFLSLHYQLVDKENYLNKITQKQLKREKDDYLTAIYLHMWVQLVLQLIFPSMFFSDNSLIWPLAKQTFLCHVFLVEPIYYAAHRWLHIPENMKAMHGFHHLSINPLPTTSLTQNFYEHFVYIATFGPAFFLPFLVQWHQHWVVIGGYLVLFDIINAWGHTNVRVRHWIFNSPYSPLTYLFYTPEFHLGHHAYFQANYALFMPIWDVLFGTYREYRKKDGPLLPKNQQDFVFIGHNGGLGHLLTIPEFSFYNVYDEYARTFLPLKLEFFIMHLIRQVWSIFNRFYYCPRYCVNNEYIARIVVLARTPWDYMSSKSYDAINRDILSCIRRQYDNCGTQYFGLGNLNKMKQLNDGGRDMVRMIEEDPYLRDKNIRIWTGDTMTVGSVYHQIADIPNLTSFFYIGARGKVGTAVCQMLVKNRPDLKIRIFSRDHFLDHPNISYSNDLGDIADYKVVLIGKILPGEMYNKALKDKTVVKTRFILDYTVPFFPIAAFQKRPEKIQNVRVGMLKTKPNNPFLKGYYDICMSHDENHIVPCHFGCLMNMIMQRESHEVGDIDQDAVHKMWQMAVARGFNNVEIDYTEN